MQPTNQIQSLSEVLPQEKARCRELLGEYKSIGPAGAYGATLIETALQRADQAVMSGDLVAMIRSYQELKDLE